MEIAPKNQEKQTIYNWQKSQTNNDGKNWT